MSAKRARRVTPAMARRAVAALVAVLECEDVDGSDRVVLEDARAVLFQFEDGS